MGTGLKLFVHSPLVSTVVFQKIKIGYILGNLCRALLATWKVLSATGIT